jgi:hypothetical protein
MALDIRPGHEPSPISAKALDVTASRPATFLLKVLKVTRKNHFFLDTRFFRGILLGSVVGNALIRVF